MNDFLIKFLNDFEELCDDHFARPKGLTRDDSRFTRATAPYSPEGLYTLRSNFTHMKDIARRQALPEPTAPYTPSGLTRDAVALHFTRASAPYTAHALTRSFAAILGKRPLLTTKLP